MQLLPGFIPLFQCNEGKEGERRVGVNSGVEVSISSAERRLTEGFFPFSSALRLPPFLLLLSSAPFPLFPLLHSSFFSSSSFPSSFTCFFFFVLLFRPSLPFCFFCLLALLLSPLLSFFVSVLFSFFFLPLFSLFPPASSHISGCRLNPNLLFFLLSTAFFSLFSIFSFLPSPLLFSSCSLLSCYSSLFSILVPLISFSPFALPFLCSFPSIHPLFSLSFLTLYLCVSSFFPFSFSPSVTLLSSPSRCSIASYPGCLVGPERIGKGTEGGEVRR